MPESPPTVLLTFVDAATGREITWCDGGRSHWGRRRCAADAVERTCQRLIPEISARSGIPVTRIEGRIRELVPAVATVAFPVAAGLLGAS